MKAKQYIEKYLPSLYKNFEISNKKWSSIYEKIDKRISHLNAEVCKNLEVSFEATIYELILYAENKDNSSICYFKFLDNLFLELSQLLPASLKKKFTKQIVCEFLENFDERTSRYIERVAEIIVLHKLLKAEFMLLEIECELKNGQKIDFCFQKEDKKYLIEVMNIKKFKPSRIKNEKNIKSFFKKRIDDKLKDKLKTLFPDDIPKDSSIFLVPVIWFTDDVKPFSKYYTYFENNKINGNLVPDFFTLSQAEKVSTGEKIFNFIPVAVHLKNLYEDKIIYQL